MKQQKFIKWVNEKFGPRTAFERQDGRFILTGQVVDYYGEFKGGYPWINPEVEAKAEKMGLSLEWENPEAVSVYLD